MEYWSTKCCFTYEERITGIYSKCDWMGPRPGMDSLQKG